MKSQILKGTFILSIAGIITRIIGFYYRIFLSQTIGATGMGLYQMIFPAFGICYSFSVVGIQMAISRFTAMKHGKNDAKGMYTVLKIGVTTSLILSALCAFILYSFSNDIAKYIFDDERCSELLRIISLSIPIGAIHSCISGYFLGKKRAGVSAWSQLLEQIVRVGSVYLITTVLYASSSHISPAIAVWGLVFGEISSALLCICFLFSEKNFFSTKISNGRSTFNSMFQMAYPITLTRIIVSFLTALEAIFIPISLRKSGLPVDTAISIYGILTGMALPFILFPSTITNSISAMILPSVAEAQSKGNFKEIGYTASKVIKYCLSIGIFCTGYFYIYGETLGEIFFHSKEAGLYISVLAWLCPFLYLTATIGSILNGMGKTKTTFYHNIISTVIRLFFIIFIIPIQGIKGCMIGILFSYILCALLHTIVLFKTCHFYYNTYEYLIKPLFITAISLGISLFVTYFLGEYQLKPLLSTVISIAIGGVVFITYTYLDVKKASLGSDA